MRRLWTIFGLFIVFLAFTPSTVQAATGPFEHVRGRILIDVDQHGEAWYVHPISGKRYYLRTPDNALAVMRALSLGITDADLERIPEPGADFAMPYDLRHVAGRILLRVENLGEAWYVDPVSLRRYHLGSPTDAMRVMVQLGLGITHQNLGMIPAASFLSERIEYDVPFTTQAPFGEWSDRRQQEGCEEAAALMAVRWARNEELTPEEARLAIIGSSDFESDRLGFYEDTDAADTADVLLREYYGFDGYDVRQGIDQHDIIAALRDGKVVLSGVNGRMLFNPHFSGVGPLQHMVVVVGYDPDTDSFIVHDPGTRFGEGYRYPVDTFAAALLDYPSGYREPIVEGRTAMISVMR